MTNYVYESKNGMALLALQQTIDDIKSDLAIVEQRGPSSIYPFASDPRVAEQSLLDDLERARAEFRRLRATDSAA